MAGERLRTERNYPGIVLAILILIGLLSKLLISLDLRLNSDSVVPGLQAMEIFKHGNIFLSGFSYPENYPAIFTDLLPFHLIPQYITNYNPDALRLAGFAIFVLIVAIYAALIFKITKDKTRSLLLMALLSNMTPSVYSFFTDPVAHGATILFAGIMIFILLDYEKLGLQYKAALAIAVFLIVFSDNLSLAVVAIPFVLACIYIGVRKNTITPGNTLIPALGILLPAILAYAIKPLMHSMISLNTKLTGYSPSQESASLVSEKSLMFVHDAFMVLNDQLFSVYNGNINLWTLFGSTVMAIILLFALLNVHKIYKTGSYEFKIFIMLMLISNILLLFGFTFTTLEAPRYLLSLSISAFALIALGYNGNKKYLALAMVVVLVGMISCIMFITLADHQPNKAEYDLIGYLKENNLTIGYSDYWDSNVLTYLSHEQVQVRTIGYKDGHMVPYRLLSSAAWYDSKPTKFFILYHVGHDDGNIGAVTSAIPWDHMLKYDDYYVFVYDMDHSPMLAEY